MDNNKLILWTDTETDGLDKEVNSILEIYVHPTGIQGEEITLPKFHIILQQELRHYIIDQKVQAMHSDNNLWTEVESVGVRPEKAFENLNNYLTNLKRKVGNECTFIMGGSSVYFDRDFLDEKNNGMFKTYFDRHLLDLSSIKMFLECNGMIIKKKETNHRARQDVLCDIEDYKKFLRATNVKNSF